MVLVEWDGIEAYRQVKFPDGRSKVFYRRSLMQLDQSDADFVLKSNAGFRLVKK